MNHNRHKTFYPDGVFETALVFFLVVLAVVILAYLSPVMLGDRADPTDTSFIPRPEWYFAFLFQALKYFPGLLEPVGTFLIPTLIIGLLIAVPLLDKNPERHPAHRPWAMAMMSIMLLATTALTILGVLS